jgi:hypothetical protein
LLMNKTVPEKDRRGSNCFHCHAILCYIAEHLFCF